MKKLFLLSVCVSIAAACGSPAGNTRTNTGVNRPNLATAQSTPGADYSQSENAYTSASNSPLGNLRSFGNKTASEIKLWQNKGINEGLTRLMGADYATMKKYWNTETPSEKFGDFMMLTGCETNNCEDNKYIIFIDVAQGGIKVVHIGEDTTREWNGRSEVKLPPPFVKELAAMKSGK